VLRAPLRTHLLGTQRLNAPLIPTITHSILPPVAFGKTQEAPKGQSRARFKVGPDRNSATEPIMPE
jgi:hypothetical protein